MIILHLTDIHADIHNPQSFLSRFQDMLKALSCLPPAWKPDVIALTGDFGYLASEQEFRLSELCIRLLFEETNLTGSQVISCAGNHDAEYTYSQNSFGQYKKFVKRLGIAERSLCINGISFFSINTCTQTTPDLCDYAVLTNTAPYTLPENSVLIMHHPPHLVTPSCTLKNMTKRCPLILSGHVHPASPSVTLFGNAVSENGCAFTPLEHDAPWGCQLIRCKSLLPGFTIEIGSLLASSEQNPDFHFSVETHHLQ